MLSSGALADLRLQRLQPNTAQSRTGNGLLHSNLKPAPPTPHPTGSCCHAHGWRGALIVRYALRRTRSHTKLRAWAFQWPPTSEPSTTNVCGPPRTSSGYVARSLRSTAAQHLVHDGSQQVTRRPAVLPGVAEVLENWAACRAAAHGRGSVC